jgi:gamma-butyrobetaine dioxygenase
MTIGPAVVASVQTHVTVVEVAWADGTRHAVSTDQLLDLCRCPHCREEYSGERIMYGFEVRPTQVIDPDAISFDSDHLVVRWSADHTSRYSFTELRNRVAGQGVERSQAGQDDGRTATALRNPPGFVWDDIVTRPEVAQMASAELMRSSILVIREMPSEPGAILRVARRFGNTWASDTGEVFNIRSATVPASLAYTERALPFHTDLSSRHMPPRFQFFHCIEADSDGAEVNLADGFACARDLFTERPEFFRTLCSASVLHVYRDEQFHFRHWGPVFEVASGQLQRIRFNPFLLEAVGGDAWEQAHTYASLREFETMLHRTEYKVAHRLSPGAGVAFDNHRLLHGRNTVRSGSRRWLQVCYVEGDEVESRARSG